MARVPNISTATPTSSSTVLGETAGVVRRFAVDELVPFVSVGWYGTNAAAIQSAIDTGVKKIRFPGGTYSLGTLSASSVLFDLVNQDGLTFVAEGAVTLSCTWANDGGSPIMFQFAGTQDVRFEGHFKFIDATGYDGPNIKGVKAIVFGDTCSDFDFESLEFDGVLAGVTVAGTADSRSVKRLKAKIKASNCLYGLNCQQNGDDIEADIWATNCRREYFVYGVRNHKIKLTIVDKHIGAASLIASYESTNKTEDIAIDIKAIWTASAPTRNFLGIQHSPNTAGGTTAGIRNIRVNYSVSATAANASTSDSAIELTAIVNGGASITSAVACDTEFVSLSGSSNGLYVYDVRSAYTLASGRAKGAALWPVTAKFDANALTVLHHAKTFAWTPAIGNGWVIGNGSTEGNYTIHNDGDAITVWGKITLGSTSTVPSAGITITLPTLAYSWAGEGSFNSGHPSTLTMVGMASLYDASATTAYQCPVKISGATGAVYLTLHGLETGGGYVIDTAPFTWAQGDTIQFFAHVIHNNTASTAP